VTIRSAAAVRSGWELLAEAVAQVLPTSEVDDIWVFPPLRRDAREWGTAVLSRVDGERRRIYTARYVLAIKGKNRGRFESSVLEVGTGPREVLLRVLQEAQRRTGDDQPPVSVPPDQWFASVSSAGPGDGSPR
jgi:hypothetical protein